MKGLALASLMLLLAAFVPFSKEANYMSEQGFARWQKFVVTRSWK